VLSYFLGEKSNEGGEDNQEIIVGRGLKEITIT